MPRPRVVISAGGVFHAYHMARGAQAAGYLQRFITNTYSRAETGLDMSKVVQLRLPALVAAVLRNMPGPRARAYSYYVGDNLFDRLSQRYVHDADIFHVFNHFGLYAMRVARQHGAITVVERCSAHPRIQARILADEYARFGLTYTLGDPRIIDKHVAEYAAADYIMICSDFVARTMLDAGVPAEKLLRVHLGFDPTRFQPGTKRDNVFRVMYAGILSLRKGLPYLFEAFARLKLPNSELLLVGQTYPDANALIDSYAGLFRHVKFVRQAELANYYRQASVFVLPSLEDGFGMVVYEAAACGLPVIISENVGAAIRDGQDGFIVPVRDVDALAEKLDYLYSHPDERVAMGRSAQRYVQQFTWENYHAEVVGHYNAIWANKG